MTPAPEVVHRRKQCNKSLAGQDCLRRSLSQWFAAVVSTLLLATVVAGAHEIPSDVTVTIIARPSQSQLDLLVRVPLEAMQDMSFPTVGPGYLDLSRSDRALTDAALRWLANDLQVFEAGSRLPQPALVATRVSIPSDRSFATYDSARAHVLGPGLPESTRLIWQQALLDVLFEVPVTGADSALAIRPHFDRLGLRVTSVVRYEAPNGVTRVYRVDGASEMLPLDPRWHQAAWRFVKQGFEHILDGTDHLLFLLCLVLPFRRQWRQLVWIVSAFTLAHSITLVGSAFGIAPAALWFTPLIELLIAVSIFYMAVENVIAPDTRMRTGLAFGFGLIHGFGFSFALADTLQFSGDHLLLSLLSFNVGVELGQLLVLAALIPLLWLLFRYVVTERLGIIVISVVVGHTAWHWMSERYAVFAQYPVDWLGWLPFI